MPTDARRNSEEDPSQVQEVNLQCHGCFRYVKVLLHIEGFMRCGDCQDVAKAMDKMRYFDNAKNN